MKKNNISGSKIWNHLCQERLNNLKTEVNHQNQKNLKARKKNQKVQEKEESHLIKNHQKNQNQKTNQRNH